MSKGSEALLAALHEAYGDQVTILQEQIIGGNLRLDFYIPSLRLAFEYHGRQHSEFVDHFHKDAAGFQSSHLRDNVKIDLCLAEGIGLVVFWEGEAITVSEIYKRSLQALPEVKPVLKSDPIGERRRAYAREQYRKQKQSRR